MVLLLSLLAAGFGGYAVTRLPIDAVPDITNNQVQINTTAPSCRRSTSRSRSPTRSRPRSPVSRARIHPLALAQRLSQVTAVFAEKLDIYFARQQVAERLAQAKRGPAARARARHGPDLDGLGEINVEDPLREAGERRTVKRARRAGSRTAAT